MDPTATAPSRRAFVTTSLGAGFAPRNINMEASIRIAGDVTTLVNVFAVEPENQQTLVQVLKEGTASFFSRQPGFISSSVLASRDGRRAVNYSQWRSAGDIESSRTHPYLAPYIQRIAALAKSETILCDVVEVNKA